MYIYIHMYIYICVCMCVYVCMYVYIYIHTATYIRIPLRRKYILYRHMGPERDVPTANHGVPEVPQKPDYPPGLQAQKKSIAQNVS